jgi:hypothetical protein
MSQRAVQRWAPLAGPIFVVLIVIAFIVGGSSPDNDASNAKILSYLSDDSHTGANEAAFLLLLVAVLFLIVFFAVLRERLVEAEGPPGRLGTLAFGAGVASTVFLVTAICVFISPIFAAHDAPRHVIDPAIYRQTQDLGYLIWVVSVVVGALSVWATSAVALQTGLLPRWFAWAGVVVGVICLFALFFIPIFVFWLWILVAGVLLATRPASVAGRPADVAATPVG